ncbi:hypothetical protein SDC9_142413 [bioreactor metagenome]|uniref:Uncharacterized protein n=1 Tax=bioreactor metagenome TaxID=1076179 RepID=A0A645E140_9ZZZZ
MVFERQTLHLGVGRHGIDALFPSCTKQLQRGVHVHLRVVEFGDGRGRHQVSVVDHHGVVIRGGDVAVARNVFIQLHMHQAVFGQRVQCSGFGFAWLQALQGLGHGHLVNDDLAFLQRRFGNAVARLDDAGIGCARGDGNARGALKKAADVDRVDGVVRALIDHLEGVVRSDDRRRDLYAARAPAVRQRHFA